MRRREFIAGLASAAAWPLVARAQQPERMRRIGVLMSGVATNSRLQSYLTAFVEALRQLGWNEGQNARIDVRWSAGDADLARTYAAQLIGLTPDVILSISTTNLNVIREATSTLPIVFVAVTDPVVQGFVASMARPGGNLTGFTPFEFSIGGKWLDLLKQVAPDLARVAVMYNPETSPQSKFFMPAITTAARSLGVEATAAEVQKTGDIEPAIASLARQPNGGLILPTDTFTDLRNPLIVELALRHHLPTIRGQSGDFVRGGGLMYYGVTTATTAEQMRQAGGYVDRILRGTKPGDLPIQRATKFDLFINLKTAKALGLTVPETLLATADEVIQ
jgi:putative tryptophan/tyrosine transport system substrate-binding protein